MRSRRSTFRAGEWGICISARGGYRRAEKSCRATRSCYRKSQRRHNTCGIRNDSKLRQEVDDMKEIWKRLMLAVAITLVAFALASLGHAQQADEDPAPGTRQQEKPEAVPQSSGKQ